MGLRKGKVFNTGIVRVLFPRMLAAETARPCTLHHAILQECERRCCANQGRTVGLAFQWILTCFIRLLNTLCVRVRLYLSRSQPMATPWPTLVIGDIASIAGGSSPLAWTKPTSVTVGIANA